MKNLPNICIFFIWIIGSKYKLVLFVCCCCCCCCCCSGKMVDVVVWRGTRLFELINVCHSLIFQSISVRSVHIRISNYSGRILATFKITIGNNMQLNYAIGGSCSWIPEKYFSIKLRCNKFAEWSNFSFKAEISRERRIVVANIYVALHVN